MTARNRRTERASEAPVVDAEPRTPSPRLPKVIAVLRALVGAVLVVGLAAAIAWGGRHYIRTSPRFALAAVDVEGNVRRSPAELTSTAGLSLGDNIFSIDLEAARARVLAEPWVAEATLTRRLPSTIRMRVKEHEAAALVVLGDTLLVTREGRVIKRVEAGDPTDLPIVTGLRRDEDGGREALEKLTRAALALSDEYEHGPLASSYPLQEVHVDERHDLSLVVGKGAVTLELGAPPYRRKLEQARAVLADVSRKKGHPDVVFLDNDGHPERVVVRLR